MNTTLDRLRVILVKDYKISPDLVTPEAPLESLGIDSLGAAELLFTIEDEFKLKLNSDPVDLPTVGDVVAFIDDLITSQHGVTACTVAGAELGAA